MTQPPVQLLTERTRRVALEMIRERGIPMSLEEFRRTNIVPPTHAAPVLRALAERGDVILVSGDRYQLASHHEREVMQGRENVLIHKGQDVGKTTTVVNVLSPTDVVASMNSECGERTVVNVIASAGTKSPRREPIVDELGRKHCRKCHRSFGPEYFVRDTNMRPDGRITTCAYCQGILAADQEIEFDPNPPLAPDAPDVTQLPRERAALTMRRWKNGEGHSLTVTIQWRDVDRLARLEQKLKGRGDQQPLEMRHYTHLIAQVAHDCAAFADTLAEGLEPGQLTIALFEALLDDEPVVP